MSSKKMISCRTCGADIAKSAKVCPSCGAKNKKPIYKRWWLWVLVLLLVIGMMPGGETDQVKADAPDPAPSEKIEPTPDPEIEYQVFTVKQLVDDLNANALKAEQTYDGQYVEITGSLDVIDSDGKYIGLYPPDAFVVMSVQCYIQNDAQREQVMGMSKGDMVTVRGKITDVGEIMGYTLDIDEIK